MRVKIDNLFLKREGGEVLLKGISLTISPGEIVGLIGDSGAGKSLFSQAIGRLIEFDHGVIKLDQFSRVKKNLPEKLIIDSHSKGLQLHFLRKLVNVYIQYAEIQLFNETVEKEILYGPENFGIPSEEALSFVNRVSERYFNFPWKKLKNRIPLTLSTGEKKKTCLLAVLAIQGELAVLDEAESGLDHNSLVGLLNFLNSEKKKKKSFLIISHNLTFLKQCADRIVGIKNGKIIFDLPIRGFFSETGIELARTMGVYPEFISECALELKKIFSDLSDELFLRLINAKSIEVVCFELDHFLEEKKIN